MGQIDVSVSGLVAPLQQPNAMACWATTYTMLYSWKRQASFTIPAALSELGEEYLQRFRQGQGLPGNQHRALANAAGLVAEPLYNPSLGGWVEMSRQLPLFVQFHASLEPFPAGLVRRFEDLPPARKSLVIKDTISPHRTLT